MADNDNFFISDLILDKNAQFNKYIDSRDNKVVDDVMEKLDNITV